MRPSTTVKIEGLSALHDALTKFSRATARGVMNRALKKAAEPIQRKAREIVAVDSGRLKKSIRTRVARDQSAGKAAFAAAMKAGATRGEAGMAFQSAAQTAGSSQAIVRIAATARHAHLVEFGTVSAPAQPFMTPAFQAMKQTAAASIEATLRVEIDKTAKRIAARGAKRITK